MKIRIDLDRCEGHGRCYTLAPELFESDDIGTGQVIGDGTVSEDHMHAARLAVANCPERAVVLEDGS